MFLNFKNKGYVIVSLYVFMIYKIHGILKLEATKYYLLNKHSCKM